MSQEQAYKYTGNISVLLRTPESLTNPGTFLLLAATIFIVGLSGIFGMYLFSAFESRNVGAVLGGAVFLFAFLILVSGLSGVGAMLMDLAKRETQRSLVEAFIAGAKSLLKFLLVILIDLAFIIVFTLVSVLVLLVCKIPFVGPILFTGVFPLMMLVSGILIAAYFLVLLPMTMPAIWDGSSVKAIYALRMAFIESRLIQVVIALLALFVIVALAAFLVNSAIFSGLLYTAGLSAGVLNVNADLNSILKGGGNGYMTAASFGGGLLFMVAMSVPALIYTFGVNLIYLGAKEGLDLSAASQRLEQGLHGAKGKAVEMKNAAAAASQRAIEAAKKQRAAKDTESVDSGNPKD